MPSTDPSKALQKALFDSLTGATLAGNNVFDQVSAASPFPRITIGTGQAVGNSFHGCGNGSEVFLDIDGWSRATGFTEVKQIGDEVRTILSGADLPLDGHSLEFLAHESTVYERDTDGLTSRARMLFRALTQPIVA